MFKINIPNSFVPERKYILDIIFEDFIGIDYLVEIKENTDKYVIVLDNDKRLVIKDNFFCKFKDETGYLSAENIPQNINFSENQFNPEKNLPIIFGSDNIEISENEIICHIDIFASSFFMLTRWEEFVIKKRDRFNRFNNNDSLVQKFNIHHRPIVNEYIDFLWNILLFLGTKQRRKQHIYSPKITHDIDFIARYDSFIKYAKGAVNDVLRRKSLTLPFKTTSDYIKLRKGLKNDPYDTFDFLMIQSENRGLKSHFYFIPGVLGEPDVKYNITDLKVENLIRNIIKRGHKIGIHGTYQSYNKPNTFREEKKRLEKIYPQIIEGRQHYLRFENPTTWQMWEDSNMQTDSTMGFDNDIGFRCGTCFEFAVFNILTRKKLKLREQPLIAMETPLKAKYKTIEGVYQKIMEINTITKKYKGMFVMLWHNSNFNVVEWKGADVIYSEIIKNI